MPTERVRIGKWTLNRTDGTLTGEHKSIRLEPKVTAVLVRLIDSDGALVSHDDLFQHVWADLHVAPGALARAISILRTALEDEAYEPRYIETVPKRGYRLIAAVEEIGEESPAIEKETPPIGKRRPLMRWPAFSALAATIALAVATAADRSPRRPNPITVDHMTRLGNETALTRFQQAVARNPSSSGAYTGLATAYLFRARYFPARQRWADEAIAAAVRATELDSGDLNARRVLAMAHLQAGHLRTAEHLFRRVLERDPADRNSRTNLGRALLFAGRIAQAAELFEDRLRAEPHGIAGYAHVAGALAFTGYPKEARLAAEAALRMEPYAHDPQLVLTRLELLDERIAAAQQRLQRMLEVYPDCAQCSVQLGLANQLEGDLTEAERHYRIAMSMATDAPAAPLRLAQILIATNRRAEAEPLLTEVEHACHAAIAAGSTFSLYPWQLAAVAAVRGDSAVAEHWYRVAVESGRRDALWDVKDPVLASLRGGDSMKRVQELFQIEHEETAPLVVRMLPYLTRPGEPEGN